MLAVDFMHRNQTIHRDIKLENILINSKHEGVYAIRIADFGLSQVVEEGQVLRRRCGTPSYIGPEVLGKNGYSLKADIFSVGSIMYNLVTGRYLF